MERHTRPRTENGPTCGGGNANLPIRETPLALFDCPSDAGPVPLVGAFYGGGWIRGNYVGNSGIGPMFRRLPPEQSVAVPGAFLINRKLRLSAITDGASNTVLVSEIVKVKATAPVTIGRCQENTAEDWRGVMHYPEGPLYHHNYTPNSPSPDQFRCDFCITTPWAPCVATYTNYLTRAVVLTARSHHPGGVNVLVADGSVRFVQDGISLGTWQALCTPSGV